MVRHSKCSKIFKSVSHQFGTLSIKGLKCDLKIRSHAFSLFDRFQFQNYSMERSKILLISQKNEVKRIQKSQRAATLLIKD